MQIVIGLLLAAPGALAVLVGACAMHRVRRLRRAGVATWAGTVEAGTRETPASPGWAPPRNPRPLLNPVALSDWRSVAPPTPDRGRPTTPPHQSLLSTYSAR